MRLLLALSILLIASPAAAGICRNQSVEGDSVTVCDNGYVEIGDDHGMRSYGYRNGGFARYPESRVPIYVNERRESD